MARMPELDPHATSPWTLDPVSEELPAFLRHDPGERLDPADTRLHFADAGPAFGGAGDADEYRAPAPAAPGYEPLAPAGQTDYHLPADSWFAAEPPPVRSAPAAAPARREWDPLVDPWPGSSNLDEPGWIERAARAAADPLGLAEPPRHQPVAFEPAPYAPVPRQPRDQHVGTTTEPIDLTPLELEHPSGPLPRAGAWPPVSVPSSPAGLGDRSGRTAAGYDVTLSGSLGSPELGFRNGQWYSLCGESARPISVGDAMVPHSEQAGQITQLVCWWLREHPRDPRAVDLATELALAVSDLARRDTRQYF